MLHCCLTEQQAERVAAGAKEKEAAVAVVALKTQGDNAEALGRGQGGSRYAQTFQYRRLLRY
jgi:hypothetical protein